MGLAAVFWARKALAVTGIVRQYLLTPHGEVAGLLLQDGAAVRFPPHLGAALTGLAGPGNEVAVVGLLGPKTPYGRAIQGLAITNQKTGQSLVDRPPLTPPLPPEKRGLIRQPLTVRGIVALLLVNGQGEVDGLILSSGEQVKFPPHDGAVVTSMVEEGLKTLEASGYGARNACGTVVEARSLSLDGRAAPLSGPGRPGA